MTGKRKRVAGYAVPLDLAAMRDEVIAEYGQEWWDRYGRASLEAALVVSGEVSGSDVSKVVAALLGDEEGPSASKPSN